MPGRAVRADLADQAEDQILRDDAARGRALEADEHLRGAAVWQRLRGEHLLDLAGADAERERAERTVCRGVRVAAHDRHAGLRHAELGADHVDDALPAMPAAIAADAELLAVPVERVELRLRELVADRQRERRRRHVVIRGREGAVGPAHRAPGEPEAVERLRARHLVHEVQVDEQQIVADHVVGEDLLVGGAGWHRASFVGAERRGQARRRPAVRTERKRAGSEPGFESRWSRSDSNVTASP